MSVLERAVEYLLESLMWFGKANYNRVILGCSVLLLSALINTQAMGSTLYARILAGAVSVDGTGFFSLSNHLVMSMDMVVMLCMMMIIALQVLKITEPQSVR